MGLPGIPELLIILAVVIVLFGGSKLPKLGGAIGESIKNFKKGIKDDQKALDPSKDDKSNAVNHELKEEAKSE